MKPSEKFQAAAARHPSVRRSVARALIAMDSGKWDESKHPRRKDGKFGSGGGSSGTSSASSSVERNHSSGKTIPKAKNPRTEKEASPDRKARLERISEYGEHSKGNRVAESDSGKRFIGHTDFKQGSAFGNAPVQGKPTKTLPKGTGTTRLVADDLNKKKHSILQYLDNAGKLTDEREQLHQQAVDNLFAGKKPTAAGKPKTFTMFGGGAAAGKGALSDPTKCSYFGTPSKEEVATIDPDELKKDIPEYRDMQAEGKIDDAAAFAHEESSAMAKRAMEAAIRNGYDYTLDGTGDGSISSVMKKINQARDAGYTVNACYVTCPTELAVERSLKRAKETGRFVPIERIRKIHQEVSRIFPKVASEFDHVKLYDTNQGEGKQPKLIAECRRGEKIVVYDQKLYDEFLAKGDEKTTDSLPKMGYNINEEVGMMTENNKGAQKEEKRSLNEHEWNWVVQAACERDEQWAIEEDPLFHEAYLSLVKEMEEDKKNGLVCTYDVGYDC